MQDSCFTAAHLNARSLVPHFNEIRDLLTSSNFDVLAISETWLTDAIPNSAISIDGYTFYRADRDGRGGGTGIYIKNTFKSTAIELNIFVEQVWIRVKIGKTVYAIGSVYRAPAVDINSFLERFEDTLSDILPTCDEMLCLGDFNINFLDIRVSAVTLFRSLLDAFGLIQLIEEPTRVTQHTSTLIDLIIVTPSVGIGGSGVIDASDISDHHVVFCDINVKNDKMLPATVTYRNFSSFNYNSFKIDLESLPWYYVYSMDDVNDKVLFINENILYLFDIHAPFKTSTFSKPNPPWLTHVIRQMMRLRDEALKKYKTSRLSAHKEYYRMLRNQTTFAIRSEQKAYFKYQFRNKNSKEMWKTLNQSVLNKRNSSIPQHFSDPDLLNTHFVNSSHSPYQPSQDTINFYNNNRHKSFISQFDFELVLESEIHKIIFSLRSNAVGVDNISAAMIKYCCPFILPYVTHVINFCLVNGVFPECWKFAQVIPVPKAATVSGLSDLRPISILPVLSKVLERVVDEQLRQYLRKHDMLPSHQSGFRPGYSCTTALLEITDDIFRAIDSKSLALVVALDYSKAFDMLNHTLMLSILRYFGLGEAAISFFTQYLLSRKQCVKLGGEFSDFASIASGVPQGSICGPLLFILYTSMLYDAVDPTVCKLFSYADDTQLCFTFNRNSLDSIEVIVNETLDAISKFSSDHCMVLNPSKSSVLLFGGGRGFDCSNINIILNSSKVHFATNAKILGLIVDTDLRFNSHVNSLIRKSYGVLKVLYSNRSVLPRQIKLLLSNSLVLSLFNHCDSVYGPCLTASDGRRIQVVQNSCLRFAYGMRRRDRISHRLAEAAWLNMGARRFLHACCLFYNVIIYTSPPYLYNKITFRTDVHHINVRHRNALTMPRHSTVYFERSYSYCIVAAWNGLPELLKASPKASFKRGLRRRLLDGQG